MKEIGHMLETDQADSGPRRPLLGRILEEKFHLLESKLEEALAYQQEKGGRLGEVLVHLRSLREEQLLEALAQQFEMKWMPQLDTSHVDHELIKKVPIAFCRRYRVLPLRYEEGFILTASTDPLETVALDDLRLLLGKPIKPILTSSVTLLGCLNRAYDEIANPAGAEQVMEDIAANQSLNARAGIGAHDRPRHLHRRARRTHQPRNHRQRPRSRGEVAPPRKRVGGPRDARGQRQHHHRVDAGPRARAARAHRQRSGPRGLLTRNKALSS